MFTNNSRDEVTLIFLKHKYRANVSIVRYGSPEMRHAALTENEAIRKTFEEVRERNALNMQGGSYEAIGKLCDEFLESIAVVEEK